ncbi:GATA transcription factor 18-like [Olea europaea subsp. europaea]|uniref:GATA transcription factor 18-like n=1 Tax=Olea europaea subsp. europaea TaxID=158383 RepID=A0A8S0QYF7_OLEEU|nr:GATA transcription factor 18-like [Olea europaea subsp. europaea]
MMHRCNLGSCSCGLFHSQNNSFSMMFSNGFDEGGDTDMYSFTSSSSSSVDCTLSLGTPSTRVSDEKEKRRSNFGWNMAAPSSSANRNHRGGSNSSANSGGDPLLARRCANCDTTSTPLWRNGPRGPKSLCNACGIRFKKEERRATAATAGATNNGGAEHRVLDSSWINYNSQTQNMPCFTSSYSNEFRFIEDDDRDSDTGTPFLSWRFNVTDRPSLVHDFTR